MKGDELSMEKSEKIVSKLGKPVAAVALHMGIATLNTACFGWYHQPMVPKTMEKFRKNRNK